MVERKVMEYYPVAGRLRRIVPFFCEIWRLFFVFWAPLRSCTEDICTEDLQNL